MSELNRLYIKREYKKNCLYYIRQVLYLIPITALILMFSTSQNIKYINQKIFLKNTSYKSITLSQQENKNKNTFKVYDANVAVVENVRGVAVFKKEYECAVYEKLNADYDFQKTYFTKTNIGKINISDLDDGEVIISYDVAKKLKVKDGDIITFYSNKSDKMFEYRVKGIIRTKYAYGNIGGSGTVIINDNNDLDQIYDNYYISFNDDNSGNIKKSDELQECNYWRLGLKSVLMVNFIFPMLGMIMVVLLLNREIKRLMKKSLYNFSILTILGSDKECITRIIYILEGFVGITAIIGTLVLYKYILAERFLGYYMYFSTLFIYGLIYSLIFLLILKLNIVLIKNKIDDEELLNTLYGRDNYNEK